MFVNVWNWDPSWKISVTEEGRELTVSPYGIYDPLHLVSYVTKRLNQNSDVTFPTKVNGHSFRVKGVSRPDSTLEIKVTDRFGNVYTETMERPRAFTTDQYKKN